MKYSEWCLKCSEKHLEEMGGCWRSSKWGYVGVSHVEIFSAGREGSAHSLHILNQFRYKFRYLQALLVFIRQNGWKWGVRKQWWHDAVMPHTLINLSKLWFRIKDISICLSRSNAAIPGLTTWGHIDLLRSQKCHSQDWDYEGVRVVRH